MRILFFAHVKDTAGCAEFELSIGTVDADGLWRALVAACPALAQHRGRVRLARNCEFVAGNAQFSDADEVALIPPVSGG